MFGEFEEKVGTRWVFDGTVIITIVIVGKIYFLLFALETSVSLPFEQSSNSRELGPQICPQGEGNWMRAMEMVTWSYRGHLHQVCLRIWSGQCPPEKLKPPGCSFGSWRRKLPPQVSILVQPPSRHWARHGGRLINVCWAEPLILAGRKDRKSPSQSLWGAVREKMLQIRSAQKAGWKPLPWRRRKQLPPYIKECFLTTRVPKHPVYCLLWQGASLDTFEQGLPDHWMAVTWTGHQVREGSTLSDLRGPRWQPWTTRSSHALEMGPVWMEMSCQREMYKWLQRLHTQKKDAEYLVNAFCVGYRSEWHFLYIAFNKIYYKNSSHLSEA